MQEGLLPTVNKTAHHTANVNDTNLRSIARNIIKIRDIRVKINETNSNSSRLTGLKVIIEAFEKTACDWVSILFVYIYHIY